MQRDSYPPGYGPAALNFMAQRTAETHAGFLLPKLKPGWNVLDAGCGPGVITLGLARKVAPGHVIGIDIEDSQFGNSRRQAQLECLNLEFHKANVYDLPFHDQSFDAVFSHALLDHLNNPEAAIAELHRVLKPGALIGVRAADLGGFLIDAESKGPVHAFGAYVTQQKESSKDPNVGRKLGRLLRKGGFEVQSMTASYEVITEALRKLGPSLAKEFADASGFFDSQSCESNDLDFVALAWCEAIGSAEAG